ncbi:SDR family oxidoreductase [Rhizobium sp. AQ_MP]|uniref:SDR family NAD(P)-dependent oxidoreductase n=1 Tax=Rhizobium sp. AQ_MP TaxID=2761536 RepID=UPI002484A739|nr:SDR family oxidoreductase [Rhizobium sp. AQ_MP]
MNFVPTSDTLGRVDHKPIAGRFSGKVAVVTGGASGMGRAQALRLAEEGAAVGVLDINGEGARETAELISARGGIGVPFEVDLTNVEQVDKAVAHIRSRFGVVHLLFNNAGTVLVKPFADTTEDDFDHLMAVNVKSAFMISRRLIPHMVDNGGGSIVMMSSVAAMRGFALEAIYGMTKAAIQALTINIAIEYRERGIRCNAICPAFVRTPHGMGEIEKFKAHGIDWSEEALVSCQLRICEPEDVAAVALYLASPDAGFLNGVAVPIDNGWMAKG